MALRAPSHSSSLATTPANINTTAANSGILAASTSAQNPAIASLASRELARKASLNALTAAQTSPTAASMSKMGADGREIAVGDVVDVPGEMHGIVRFVGSVRGKKGVFAGVELGREFAIRGKNDGDVDGVQYFSTTVPGAGIFLPLHRASKRSSQGSSGFAPTPTTPSFDPSMSINQSTLPKFSQSVGPGARPSSPSYKSKGRQSLPRPESPLRKPPVLAPTPGRGPSYGPASLSRSQIGAPRFTPSPIPKGPTKTPQPAKVVSGAYPRASSRAGGRMSASGDADATPTAINPTTRSSDGSGVTATTSSSGFTPMNRRSTDDANEEINRLKKQLEDRDRQLKDQAVSLAEMESSLQEIQTLLPGADLAPRSAGPNDDADAAQLRAIIREKNEKISLLTAEFDDHRLDLRSTLDALELAGTETERMYEKRVEELLAEIRDMHQQQDDVDKVSNQFRQLEGLVQELEESVEDARRGEAEARGDAEFLRGEVERTKLELRRERERTMVAIRSAEDSVRGSSAGDSRDLEQRDDEIRGLKAIIHSLSSGPDLSEASTRHSLNRSMSGDDVLRLQSSIDRLEREKKELQGLVERKVAREEELEQEIETLHMQQRSSVISNAFSDRTAIQEKRSSGRDSKGTVLNWRDRSDVAAHSVLNGARLTSGEKSLPMKSMPEADTADSASSTAGSAVLWCEICESGGHDILTCPNIETPRPGAERARSSSTTFHSATLTPTPTHPVKTPVTPSSAAAHYKNASSISSLDPDKPRPLMMGLNSSKGSLPLSSPTALPPPPGAAPTGPLPRPGLGGGSSTNSSAMSVQKMVAEAMGRSGSMEQPPQQALPPLTGSSASSLVAGRDGTRNANKWCAICEHDGHDSINCAMEDQF